MKSLLLLALLAGSLFAAGCSCACASHYPHDTFIGASGWPAAQVPITQPAR